MKKFNISKPKKYIKNGEEKTFWNTIGTYTEFENTDGSVSRKIEIPAISLEAQVFPVENRSAMLPKPIMDLDSDKDMDIPQKPVEDVLEYPEEVVNSEDIPF